MKAFKLASAFAVTGLALAVSGQAMAADTTTDWTWSGSVGVESILMDNTGTYMTNVDVLAPGAGSRSSLPVATDLVVSIDVANGGFSANMEIDNSTISVSDFLYEEGAFMFGEVGTIVASEGYVADMDTDAAGSYDVDGGFRYTSGGFKVQAESNTSTEDYNTASGVNPGSPTGSRDVGLAVAFAGEFEGGSFVVDAQYGEDPTSGSDAANEMYYGVGVTMAASDAVTVMAGYTSGIGAETAMGLRADYTADAFTAYASYVSNSADADSMIMLGGTATVSAFKLYADYDVNPAVLDIGASTAGASGAMTYSASVDMADVTGTVMTDWAIGAGYDAGVAMLAFGYASRDNAATSEITASATHTTEGGATLALAYEVDTGTSTDLDDSNFGRDTLVATASYSF